MGVFKLLSADSAYRVVTSIRTNKQNGYRKILTNGIILKSKEIYAATQTVYDEYAATCTVDPIAELSLRLHQHIIKAIKCRINRKSKL